MSQREEETRVESQIRLKNMFLSLFTKTESVYIIMCGVETSLFIRQSEDYCYIDHCRAKKSSSLEFD